MTKENGKVTKCDAALARGAEGKESTHCRKSLTDQRAARPKVEPEVTTAKAKKAIKRAAPKGNEAAVRRAVKASFKKIKAPATRLSLKQNREVRDLLTKAAQAAGGTRLTPIGFDSYTTFLAGVPLDADGNATVVFVPVKGNSPVTGKNVKLTIKGGKVAKIA